MPTSARHNLLERQLKKAGLDLTSADPALERFVKLVDAAYKDLDSDRKLQERAIDLSSMEMIEANNELKRLAESAQNAAQSKANFLANMSHEIRTPLNGILGISEMLKDLATGDGVHALLDLLLNSSQGLLTVVNDILDLSKIEAGKYTIVPKITDLKVLTTEIVNLFSAVSRQRDVELVLYHEPSLPQEVKIDAARIRQIVTNLLGNAVKFAHDGGGIVLFVHCRQLEDGQPGVRISVADTGIGISESALETIFQAFSQVNSSVSRKFGGTGLGLTITQNLVSLMGGKIEVKSKEGVGSLFQVTLPYDLATKTDVVLGHSRVENEHLAHLDLSKMRVLLAEDNLVNQKVALRVLEKLGMSVTVANNGREAINFFREDAFDIILMDCQMPEVSGFEAASTIRTQPGGDRVPIIALTALAMEGDRKRCIDSGMDDYITKPFKREELQHVIARWVGRLQQK